MTCEEVRDQLLEYVEGDAPDDRREAIRAHLDACAACAAAFRETRALVGDLSVARSLERRAWDSGATSPGSAARASLAPGARLGDFELLEELGRGGMGVVYRARQVTLNRVVALKVLSAGVAPAERAVARFQREAQAAARLHHTNIVPVYAQGHESGLFYYAMELIEGVSLEKVLAEERAATGAGPGSARTQAHWSGPEHPSLQSRSMLRSAVSLLGGGSGTRAGRDYKRIARQMAGVAEGLHHAHEEGVVHRDIKPQNLLLGGDGELHITDFGLARLLDEPGMTLSSELVGTPAYMAPEQVSPDRGAVDRRTDIYALGITLYELLAHRRPFEADTYDRMIHEILRREPASPRRFDPRAPLDLETICLRAMEKAPLRRFQTAAEMAKDLRRYAQDFPIASRRVSPLGKAWRWMRRRPALASAIGATALSLILAPLLWLAVTAKASEEISNAFDILLDDYRERDQALAALGWMSQVAGDTRDYQMALAFANLIPQPKRASEILAPLCRARPRDRDLRYLLAWAYYWRTWGEGPARWSDCFEQIRLADALVDEPVAASGHFFRAQALAMFHPGEAVKSFDRAIVLRPLFVQAMEHKGRALNQLMYFKRSLEYSGAAIEALRQACELQPNKGYPRYLLSFAHLLTGDCHMLAAERSADEAEQIRLRGQGEAAFERAERLSREARVVEPTLARAYTGEPFVHELRAYWSFATEDRAAGQASLRRAIEAWDLMPMGAKADAQKERYGYQSRLLFWVGELDSSLAAHAKRYGPESGYDADTGYQVAEDFLAAILHATRGESPAALKRLRRGEQRTRGQPEERMLIRAAYRLLGADEDEVALERRVDADARLSPQWTPEWAETLAAYLHGDLKWDHDEEVQTRVLEQAARHKPKLELEPWDNSFYWLAPAHFYRGIDALRRGERREAQRLFKLAWRQHDNENYCFFAQWLYFKMLIDPAWPPWID